MFTSWFTAHFFFLSLWLFSLPIHIVHSDVISWWESDKKFWDMSLLLAIFKFCITVNLFKYLFILKSTFKFHLQPNHDPYFLASFTSEVVSLLLFLDLIRYVFMSYLLLWWTRIKKRIKKMKEIIKFDIPRISLFVTLKIKLK